MAQAPGFKLRLRHITNTPRHTLTTPPQIIKKNLEPLKYNTKKKVAQTLYYEQNPKNQSPLIKEVKGPVHQRLGVKQIRLRRLFPLGTNTSSVLPKKKSFKRQKPQYLRIQNTPGQFKRYKAQRLFSAQSRIERIRAQQRNNSPTIKLRRLHGGIPPATNLTVHVKNPNFDPSVSNGQAYGFHEPISRFKMQLIPAIQAEILEIQQQTVSTGGSLPPLTRITPVTTEIPISARFGLL